MKNLKLYIINLFLCTMLIVFHSSLISRLQFDNFDNSQVINRITYLTSDELQGRLCGSDGNYMAQDYIINNFKQHNLLPYKSSFLQEFSTYYPKEIDGNAYLNIVNDNKEIIKSYKYNRDFKDAFLNFKINNVSFSKTTTIKLYPSALLVKNNDGSTAIFISSEMDSFNFRSSFVHDTPIDLYTMVSPKTFNELIEYYNEGYTIECYFPYNVEEVKVNNIAGVIKGKNPFLPPLVLTAHFDHLGKDLDGNIYRGALDNASGVSFLMELSSYLSSLPTPNRDIIIVALNAEEFGLLGAEAFAVDNSKTLKNSKVINFDMIGSDHNIPITLMTGKDPEDKKELLTNLINICNNKKIPHIVESKDSSDHSAFLNHSIDSVTINDGDVSKIHTPDDKVEYISTTAINRAFSLVWPEIYNTAYSSSGLFMLDTNILILTFIICMLSIFLSAYTKKE